MTDKKELNKKNTKLNNFYLILKIIFFPIILLMRIIDFIYNIFW